jgi:hypothetical protein
VVEPTIMVVVAAISIVQRLFKRGEWACTAANIEPLIATGRQPYHPFWRERFAAPPPAPENPTPVEAMAWRLRTPQGKQLSGLRAWIAVRCSRHLPPGGHPQS